MKKMIALAVVASLVIAVAAEAQVYLKRDITKLEVGMNTDQVRSAFGRPSHINRYGNPPNETQQWIYKEGRYKELYLYFENGLFKSYQRFGEK